MNKQGFTLVEVLVAAGLFVIIVSGLTATVKLSNRYLSSLKKYSQTVNRLRGTMEELRVIPFDKLAAFSSPGVRAVPLSSELYLIEAEEPPLKISTLRSKD